MKRLLTVASSVVALAIASGPEPARAETTETECCWLYCESYRMICERSLGEDDDYCQAFYEGCIDGCQYPEG